METPTRVVAEWRVVTYTGAVYYVAREQTGRWWMRAENEPAPTATLDPDRWWPIRPPWRWPPSIGRSLELDPPPGLPEGDPRCCPGGTVVTAPVREVRGPS